MSVSLLGCSVLNKKNLSNLIVYTDIVKATKLSLWDRFADFFKFCKNKMLLIHFTPLFMEEMTRLVVMKKITSFIVSNN